MNLEETADFISSAAVCGGATLPQHERDANLRFLETVHRTVRNGGKWIYPSAGLVFTATEEGFMLDTDTVLVEQ